MSQRTCKHCGSQYDDHTPACPSCGARNRKVGWIPWLLVLTLMALFLEIMIVIAR